MSKIKAVLPIFFLFSMVLIAGCETAKGLAKDTANFWHGMCKADSWVKENLW